jgi:hypothetical protein
MRDPTHAVHATRAADGRLIVGDGPILGCQLVAVATAAVAAVQPGVPCAPSKGIESAAIDERRRAAVVIGDEPVL